MTNPAPVAGRSATRRAMKNSAWFDRKGTGNTTAYTVSAMGREQQQAKGA